MSRILSNYFQGLVNDMSDGINEGLQPLIRRQMLQEQQEWEEKRKGGQIAEFYKAKQAEKLGNNFFNQAQQDRDLRDTTANILQNHNSFNPTKSQNELMYGNINIPNNVFNPNNSVASNMSLADFIKQENPFGAGDILYGKGYQNREQQQPNMFTASSKFNQGYLKNMSPLQSASAYESKKLNDLNNQVNNTLSQVDKVNENFWQEQIDLINRLTGNYNNYAVNPLLVDGGVDEFRLNPLTKDKNRIAELSANGNLTAAQQLHNEIYPDMKLRNREYISPDGRTKVNEELLYNISPDGNYTEQVINKQQSPYMSQKDLEDLRYKRQLGLLNAKAKASGKEDLHRLTPNQLASDLNEKNVTDPILRSALAFVNEHGSNSDYNMLRQYNPNIKPVENTFFGKFTGRNNKEQNRYNEQEKKNQEVDTYMTNLYGSTDFYKNPLKENYKDILANYGYSIKIPTNRKNSNPNVYEFYIDGVYDSDKTISDIHNIVKSLI